MQEQQLAMVPGGAAALPAKQTGRARGSAELAQLARNKIYAGVPDDDVKLALAICDKYGLDPLLKHVVLIGGKARDATTGAYTTRYNVYITRDGLLYIAHASGQLDGMEVTTGQDQRGEYAECTVWRKDMGRPFRYRVYRREYDSGIGAWKTHPSAMLTKTAEVFTLRRAFNVALTPVEEMGFSEQEFVYIQQPVQPVMQLTKQVDVLAALRKKAVDTAATYNVEPEEVREMMKYLFGKDSSRDLTGEELEKLIAAIEEVGLQRIAEKMEQDYTIDEALAEVKEEVKADE